MKYDVILAGIGGQGVISVASIIAQAVVSEGLEVRQSEVHGMAQRGGAVISHMRIAKGSISSDLVPKGSADLIIGMEPLEALRYLAYLKPDGMFITSSAAFPNIPNYPNIDDVISSIKGLPKWRLVDAAALAKEAGLAKSANTVMIGAASNFLPVKAESLEKTIAERFAQLDAAGKQANIKAFKLGQTAVKPAR